jgi:long-chain fatty acid transport protein
MKKVLFTLFLFFISAFLISQTLVETQFSAPIGFGARAFGMGGAFIAIADDATAATWNPGGLGQIEHIEISGIGSYYDFERYESAIILNEGRVGTIMRQGDSFSYDFIGISVPFRPFAESDFKVVLQYSYQKLINFNINSNTNPIQYVKFDTNELGHNTMETGYRFEDEEFTGGLDAHSIGLGFKITKWLNVGITTKIWTNGYQGGTFHEFFGSITDLVTKTKQDHIFTQALPDGSRFKGTSFNFGTLIQVTDNLSVGAVFKNSFTLNVNTPDGISKYRVDYPLSLGFGAAFRPVDNLTLAADFTYTNWSKGRAYNDNFNMFFPMTQTEYKEKKEGVEEPKNWFQHDTYQWRFGAEYVFIAEDLLIPLRAGIYFDNQYFADILDKIPSYLGLTTGVGVVWNDFIIDVAVVYVSGDFTANVWATGPSNFSYLKGIASLIFRF